jgi:hypothetical protein
MLSSRSDALIAAFSLGRRASAPASAPVVGLEVM